MDKKKQKRIHIVTLAFGIAFLPPLWAVLSPYMGVTTGAVALICAGLYVANGNKRCDAFRIAMGFLCGDVWAVLVIWITSMLSFNPDFELYATLFLLGGLAVLIGESIPKYIFLPSWLCGWAIGLTIMGPMKLSDIGTLPIQIGVAMVVGVVYVGIGVDVLQRLLMRWLIKEKN